MQSDHQRSFVTFNLHYRCDFGFSVYVVLSTANNYFLSLESAIRLEWQQGDYWSKTIGIQLKESELSFHYKYIVGPSNLKEQGFIRWEQGLRRCFRVENAAYRQFIIEDIWEHQKIKILLRNVFTPEESRVNSMGILSRTLTPQGTCMELRLERHGNMAFENYWASEEHWISLNEERIDIFVYLLNGHKKKIVKNRRVDLKYLLNPDKMVQKLQKGIQIEENNILIVEPLQYKDFIYSEINSRLILGARINHSDEGALLSAEKVGAIMSLETLNDRKRHKKSDKLAQAEGIIPKYSYPIEDCPQSLILKAVKGAQYLKQLVETHKKVYVHCTYGVFRSVHVVIAYLHLYEQMELLQAIDLVQRARSQSCIRKDICTQMLINLELNEPKEKFHKFQGFFGKKRSDLCNRVV